MAKSSKARRAPAKNSAKTARKRLWERRVNFNTTKNEANEKSRVAWISAGAAIAVAVITGAVTLFVEFGKDSPVTSAVSVPSLQDTANVPTPFWLELGKPVVVWPKREDSKYGYTALPKIQIEGTCSDYLEQDALCAQCDKAGLTESSSLEEVGDNCLAVERKVSARRVVATFDCNSFICSSPSYTRTPHGAYRVLFKLTAQRKPEGLQKGLLFNYVYEEDFSQLSSVLSTRDEEFVSVPGKGGLEMTVLSGKRRVSANLKQEFDFKTNFCILGCFTAEFEDRYNPSSLDISVCDAWGEKLSVVFADGNLDTFSIKARGEAHGEKDVTIERARTGLGRTIGDETIFNFFEIRVQEHGDKTRCTLFLRQNSPIPEGDLPIHGRFMDNLKFLTDFTHINLKLRKPGRVRLYNFEVAQIPIALAGW